MIRIAKDSDAAALLEIYKPYVEDTAITFDMKVPSLIEYIQKMKFILSEAPFLVCEINGKIVGFAYADRFRPKEAYKWTREVTVYVDKEHHSNKYGSALYYSLIDLLKCQNYRNVVAGITLPNIPSVSFHERIGFHQVGVYDNVGYKLGKAHRVGWWQMSLQEYSAPALDIIPLEEVIQTEEGKKALKNGELRLFI